ncbi:MAG: hypothetical protein Q8P01_02465 [bacterium]|nr:hypothetical protein [bacterium]
MKVLKIRDQYFISFLVLAVGVFVSMLVFAQAQGLEGITYPVAELGNCANERACKTYCDDSAHLGECLDFAEEQGLMDDDELEQARKFEAAGGSGPGGCTGKDSCEAYCNNITHMDECLAFAEENDFMPPEELEEARKVQAALKGGATLPGGCKTKDECESYCQNPERPERMEECITFAEAAGFIPPEELGEARKVLQAVKRGVKPPPCAGKRQCDDYCNQPENFEGCLAFAEAAGLIPPEELAQAKQALIAIRKGVAPPKCRGQEECDTYCAEPEHTEECMNFAIAAGFMSEEDAEMMRKTGGKGPGNCRGREECEAFCEDPVNQESCFMFAKEHGLISEEDLEQMEDGKEQMREALEEAPEEVLACFNEKLGSGMVERLIAGTAVPSQEIGSVMQECFQSMMSQGGEFGPGEFGEGEFGGEGFEGEGFERGRGPGGPFGPSPDAILQSVPGEVRGCVESMLGSGGLGSGSEGIRGAVEQCMRSAGGFDPGDFERPVGQEGEEGFGSMGIEGQMEQGTQDETQRRMQEEIQRRTQEAVQQQLQGFGIPAGFEGGVPPEGFQLPAGFQPPTDFQQPQEPVQQQGSLLKVLKRILFVGAK